MGFVGMVITDVAFSTGATVIGSAIRGLPDKEESQVSTLLVLTSFAAVILAICGGVELRDWYRRKKVSTTTK